MYTVVIGSLWSLKQDGPKFESAWSTWNIRKEKEKTKTTHSVIVKDNMPF